jgi:predicted nucleotidyltransferase
MSPEFDVRAYVRKLATAHRNVREMWLLGSRANGSARPKSDWDILAFADEPTFNALRDDQQLHHPDIDLLVVKSVDGRFEKPWGRKKSGSLEKWQWNRVSETDATYRSTKFVPDPGETHHGDFHEQILKATRLWPEG